MNKAREYWADELRILSSFFVVLIHVSANAWYTPSLNLDWIVSNVFCAIGHLSVPLFFMLSGMFFLNPKKEVSIKRLLSHNILRLFLVYVVSMLGYGLWMLIQIKVSGSMPLNSFGTVLSVLIQGHSYLWFLPVLIGIYFITPILRYVTADNTNGRKVIEYYLLLFISLNLLTTTLIGLQISDLLSEILAKYLPFQTLNAYVGYYILGYYLATYDMSEGLKKWLNRLWIPALLAMTCLPVLQVFRGQTPSSALFDSFSIFTFILCIKLFLFFKQKRTRTRSPKMGKFLILFSSTTLGIYILHAWVIDLLLHADIRIENGPLFFTIPAGTVFVFLLSFLLSLSLRFVSIIWKKLRAEMHQSR